MKLQILVPQHTETDDIVKVLLDSISMQQTIDFGEVGVIICNDGTDVHLSREMLDSYPFEVQYHLERKRGVSGTRNACFDHSEADYVMFCDADDMFCDACGLYVVFREINNGGFDTFVSCFREETKDPDGNSIYINREMDSTFVHGKVYSREFLVRNRIRWNDDLTIHEDSFFNILARELTGQHGFKYYPAPFYLWKWRDDSVCRHDKKYILKTYNNLLDSNDALISEFLSRGLMDKASFYVATMTFDAYYTMNKPDWVNQENQTYRNATERRFKRYIESHYDLWNAVPMQVKMHISRQVRDRSIDEGMQMEAVTIGTWLDHVRSLA
mgnify:CR=1 FL=1